MNKLVKLGGRLFTSALLCGSLMMGTAAADPAPAADGMAAFREAIEMSTKEDRRVFHQDILFFVPSGRADLDMLGRTKGNSLRLSGNFSITGIDDNAEPIDFHIPFYLDQKADKMTIYYQFGKKWRKFQAPTLAAAAMDEIATPDQQDADEIMSMVKSVTILRETDTQRTMLVMLDSEKLADTVAAANQKNPADNATADEAEWQNSFIGCVTEGIRRANIWYTWTVNRKTGETVTASYNLSSIAQEAARVALERNPEWTADITALIEPIAYYSDTKAYTTFLNPKAAKKLEIPDEVKEAAEVNELVPEDAKTVTASEN